MKTHILLLAFSTTSMLVAQNDPVVPEKLSTLKSSYQATIKRATTPITKTYIAELEKLKTDYTKKGDLNAALAVDDRAQPPCRQMGRLPKTMTPMVRCFRAASGFGGKKEVRRKLLRSTRLETRF